MTELATIERPAAEPARTLPAIQHGTAVTPMEMLNTALERGADPDVLGKLMALQERWEANQGRKAFNAAIAAAKAEIVPVVRNSTGHNEKRYADFAAYAKMLDPILPKHGLTYRFRTTQANLITVTCILSHIDGYAEENSLSAAPDNTGNKNSIQAIGSAQQYLMRYTLIAALGLSSTKDDDGVAAGKTIDAAAAITPEQAKTLEVLVKETGTDLGKMLTVCGCDALADIHPADFPRVLQMLQTKKRMQAQEKAAAKTDFPGDA
jgi:hypothetical protein